MNNQDIFNQVKETNMKIKFALKTTNCTENKWILNKSIAMKSKINQSPSVASLSS